MLAAFCTTPVVENPPALQLVPLHALDGHHVHVEGHPEPVAVHLSQPGRERRPVAAGNGWLGLDLHQQAIGVIEPVDMQLVVIGEPADLADEVFDRRGLYNDTIEGDH